MHASAHNGFAGGGTTVDPSVNGFDPSDVLRDFDWGKTRRLSSGRVVREWELVAFDKEIEIVPGVKFQAWTYNGRVPGPTLRCREGDLLRINFVNDGSHPHTIHFHGIHPAAMDGTPGIGEEIGGGLIGVGQSFTYEFEASPFGLHLYHCHASPLAGHIAKGLYGMFVIDPRQGRPDADELVMVQNAFDPDFDLDNEVYAVNTVAFHFMYRPIRVRRKSSSGSTSSTSSSSTRSTRSTRMGTSSIASRPGRRSSRANTRTPSFRPRDSATCSSFASRTSAGTCSTHTRPSSPRSWMGFFEVVD